MTWEDPAGLRPLVSSCLQKVGCTRNPEAGLEVWWPHRRQSGRLQFYSESGTPGFFGGWRVGEGSLGVTTGSLGCWHRLWVGQVVVPPWCAGATWDLSAMGHDRRLGPSPPSCICPLGVPLIPGFLSSAPKQVSLGFSQTCRKQAHELLSGPAGPAWRSSG